METGIKSIRDSSAGSLTHNYREVPTGKIAEDTAYPGYAQARAILSKVDGRKYPEVIKFDPENASYQARTNNQLFNSGKKFIRN